MTFASYMELATAARARIDAGDRESALAILAGAQSAFPLHAGHTYVSRAELLLELGRSDEALDVLDEALAEGCRFKAEWLLQNRRLALLHGSARFEDIVTRGASRYARDQEDSAPALQVLMPTTPRRLSLPTVFALHGNYSNVGETYPYWKSAADLGWLVALPQSSEIGASPNSYTWNDRDRTLRELERHLMEVRQLELMDERTVVLAGFSMGGLQALALVLTRRFPALGALSVGAYLPHIREFSALIASDHAAGSRFYIVVGDRDPSGYDGAKQLVAELEGAGVEAILDERRGLGHAYPEDMDVTLRRALAFMRPAVPTA